jgi:hypothetical protein
MMEMIAEAPGVRATEGCRMKRILLLLLLGMGLLPAVLAAEPADGAYDESKMFYLADEQSGYRIHFPDYAGSEIRAVKSGGAAFEAEVNILGAPAGEGDVLLFEVIVTDPDARALDVLIGDDSGYAAELKGLEPEKGKAEVRVSRELWEAEFGDRVLHADIFSRDASGELLWHFFEIYFMYGAGPEEEAPEADAGKVRAVPVTANVAVDGRLVAFDAYSIGGNTYLKLRDLAMALNGSGKPFEVEWDGARKVINLVPGAAYTPVGGELELTEGRKAETAVPSRAKIHVDGREVRLAAYTIGGNNHFRLRDIATVLNIGVTWDGATRTVGLDTSRDDAA